MNIFATSPDPIACAQALDNRRLVKMVLETAQLLATTHNLRDGPGTGIYKTTHSNHPCAIWVRETDSNYRWTFDHFKALCEEYTLRYRKVHKCAENMDTWNRVPAGVPVGPRTPFVNCTPHKATEVHAAYTRTMQEKWAIDRLNGREPLWNYPRKPPVFA